MKLFDKFLGTDNEKAVLDRRLFLQGAMLTAAGLIVPKPPAIFVPAPVIYPWSASLTRYYFIDYEDVVDAAGGLSFSRSVDGGLFALVGQHDGPEGIRVRSLSEVPCTQKGQAVVVLIKPQKSEFFLAT